MTRLLDLKCSSGTPWLQQLHTPFHPRSSKQEGYSALFPDFAPHVKTTKFVSFHPDFTHLLITNQNLIQSTVRQSVSQNHSQQPARQAGSQSSQSAKKEVRASMQLASSKKEPRSPVSSKCSQAAGPAGCLAHKLVPQRQTQEPWLRSPQGSCVVHPPWQPSVLAARRPPKMLSQTAFTRMKKHIVSNASALKLCKCKDATPTHSQLTLAFMFLQQMVGSPT